MNPQETSPPLPPAATRPAPAALRDLVSSLSKAEEEGSWVDTIGHLELISLSRQALESIISAPGSGDFSIGGSLWPGLSKLAEECGEVQQVVGKLIGSEGRENHWDGTNLRERLQEELADLTAAVEFVQLENDLDAASIRNRADRKLRRFREWHAEGYKGPLRPCDAY